MTQGAFDCSGMSWSRSGRKRQPDDEKVIKFMISLGGLAEARFWLPLACICSILICGTSCLSFASSQTLHLCRVERPRTTRHYTRWCFSVREAPNVTPVKVSRSRGTKYYTCAGLSARDPPNITPVHVSALTKHKTLHRCRFEISRNTKHYACASLSAREEPNTALVQV